ncbi:MAG: histidine kinase [Saprospiraceae bacterium]|nr:histidine kinase [Saprospiraceae bacterium]
MTQLSILLSQDASYIQYTTEDGLPTNYVYGVVEDEDGYIWAYTENGMAKFDGYTFKHYSIEDGLPGNDITFADKAPDGKIWLQPYHNRPAYLYKDSVHITHDKQCTYVGIWDGMALYSCHRQYIGYRDSFINYNLNLEIDSFLFKKYPDRFITVDSVFQKSPRPYHAYVKSSNRTIEVSLQNMSYIPLNNGNMFISYSPAELIYKKSGKNWQILPLSPQNGSALSISRGLNSYHLTGENKLIVSSYKKGFFFIDLDKDSVSEKNLSEFGLFPKSHTGVSVFDQHFWVSTDDGGLRFDFNGQLQEKVQIKSLSNKYFLLRFFSDRSGNIWIGSRNGGLFLIPQAHKRVTNRSLVQEKQQHFERILSTSKGTIIGITANSGVYDIQQDTMLELLKPNKERRFRSAINTPKGVWISTSTQAYLMQEKNGQFHFETLNDFFEASSVNVSTRVEDFFSVRNFNVYHNESGLTYHPEEQTVYSIVSSSYIFKYTLELHSNQLYFDGFYQTGKELAYHPERKLVYLGGIDGVYQLDGHNAKPLLPDDVNLTNVSALLGTPDKLWIGTEGKGLFCYDFAKQQLDTIGPFKYIRNIRLDGNQGVMVASNKGVIVIPFNTPKDFIQYTIRDGLPTNEIEDVFAQGDSMIYIASAKGLHQLDRLFVARDELSPDLLRIHTVTVQEETIPLDQLGHLQYFQNDITIDYSLRAYSSHGNITYATMLEPLEQEWQLSKNRSRSFLALPSGKYTFHLKATDAYGNEVMYPRIPIVIGKAFWQKLWFSVFCVLLFVGSIVGVVVRRFQKENKRLRDKRKLEKRIANLELDALKAQMNPHFIFNALGAIQYFIQTQEVDAADDYLTMFARLMREYLDSAREKMIPLEQEISLLGKYTQLEKMRFEELFDVEMEVSKDLATANYFIPSMLLQPFVENAINHGLSERRDGKGVVRILFEEQASSLVCTIEDNGIGREKAKQKKRKNHRSQGMKIVKEKIDTLRTSKIADIFIKTEDAFPGENDFPGTRVIIRINNLEDEEIKGPNHR